jgi:hypothetical protein
MVRYSRAPAEKPAAIIDFPAMHNLGTKVLADNLTIDEILHGCSNPKVERLKTEVYGYGMKRAIAFQFQLWGQTQSSQKPLLGALC